MPAVSVKCMLALFTLYYNEYDVVCMDDRWECTGGDTPNPTLLFTDSHASYTNFLRSDSTYAYDCSDILSWSAARNKDERRQGDRCQRTPR